MMLPVDRLKPDYLLLTERGKAWLEQFKPDDRETARRLVNGLTLVSLTAFDRTVERLVRAHADTIEGPVALYAVREIDPSHSYFDQAGSTNRGRPNTKGVDAVGRGPDIGSEGRVAATVRAIARTDRTKFLNHPSIVEMRAAHCRAIIVVDDLIGSGKRTREFLDAIWADRTIRAWHSLKYLTLRAVAFATTTGGSWHVRRATYHPTLVSERTCPTADDLPWLGCVREAVADLCYEYGERTAKRRMSLGFRDTMAMLVFEHGCPNNVPAILWAPAGRGKAWEPLFPNRSVTSDERSVFPPEIARREPISVLIDLGQKRLAQAGLRSVRGSGGRQIIALLAMAAKRIRRFEAFATATGLSNRECRVLLERCIEWGFLTHTYHLTPAGRAELDRARRQGRLKPKIPPKGEETYYPRTLREATGG